MALKQKRVNRRIFLRTAAHAALGCGTAITFLGPRSALARPWPPRPQRIKVYRRSDLEFGTFASDVDFAGTVTINATTGARTLTGGLFDFGGVATRAEFLITGEPYTPIEVEVPSTITVTGKNTGRQMTVRNITTTFTNPLVLNYTRYARIYIGGTLEVATAQSADTYRSEFEIEAEYVDD